MSEEGHLCIMETSQILKILERLYQENLHPEFFSGKRVLITGGAGFIGSWLVEALVRLGAKVFVLDNLWRGSLDNLQKDGSAYWIPLSEQFVLGDLKEYHVALSACIKTKPDIVFHLADIVAGVDYVFANEPFLFRANLLINTNVFSAAREAGVKQLVYVGTACSYPKKLQEKPGSIPLFEDQVYPADPESAYGWSKLMGEYEAELLGRYSDTQIGILRLHNVFGPRSIMSIKRSQVIPSLIRKAIRYPEEDFIVWGSGKQSRDFVFVGDVIDALLRLPLKGMNKGPIQIGTSKETSVADLASMIVQISNKEIPIIFDKTKPEGDAGRCGSYAKAEQILGWKVSTSIFDGLKQTYQWAENQIKNSRINFEQ
jgi:GDP-D-mannose 3', 5'-epimerase